MCSVTSNHSGDGVPCFHHHTDVCLKRQEGGNTDRRAPAREDRKTLKRSRYASVLQESPRYATPSRTLLKGSALRQPSAEYQPGAQETNVQHASAKACRSTSIASVAGARRQM
ncbi:hypothetical protein NDU88_007187 [Pleurodeles waltl]|uniref:Uncharacterized protein n=1 Tax=Pleurodeles waltl TaxID=8319 RepID=A0AAV7U2A7_PLEWA|nr:hypothetical protein NDU88_007187 [Pleurodeles waltl]